MRLRTFCMQRLECLMQALRSLSCFLSHPKLHCVGYACNLEAHDVDTPLDISLLLVDLSDNEHVWAARPITAMEQKLSVIALLSRRYVTTYAILTMRRAQIFATLQHASRFIECRER
jgi:hypothetical protein